MKFRLLARRLWNKYGSMPIPFSRFSDMLRLDIGLAKVSEHAQIWTALFDLDLTQSVNGPDFVKYFPILLKQVEHGSMMLTLNLEDVSVEGRIVTIDHLQEEEKNTPALLHN
jgi:hypothetical protein